MLNDNKNKQAKLKLKPKIRKSQKAMIKSKTVKDKKYYLVDDYIKDVSANNSSVDINKLKRDRERLKQRIAQAIAQERALIKGYEHVISAFDKK